MKKLYKTYNEHRFYKKFVTTLYRKLALKLRKYRIRLKREQHEKERIQHATK